MTEANNANPLLLTRERAREIARPRAPIWVTYATMVTCNGRDGTATYHVYRAPLYAARMAPYIKLDHPKTRRVASITVSSRKDFSYLDAVLAYATPQYPAWNW